MAASWARRAAGPSGPNGRALAAIGSAMREGFDARRLAGNLRFMDRRSISARASGTASSPGDRRRAEVTGLCQDAGAMIFQRRTA